LSVNFVDVKRDHDIYNKDSVLEGIYNQDKHFYCQQGEVIVTRSG